jgi:glycosyltransferase involved in cell wall biosynthesis
MRDLAREFLNQGYDPVVLVPMNSPLSLWELEVMDGVQILRLSSPMMQDVGRFRRALSEIFLPLSMIYALKKSPYGTVDWTYLIWYSPPIFFGPLIWYLKRSTNCRTYLILRDIFPEWALDLGLIRKGLIYWFFKAIANFQYSIADTIGIQTGSNISYFQSDKNKYIEKVVVLDNWQTESEINGSSIQIGFTSLANRKIFVYVGNMCIAQGMDVLIDLAALLNNRSDIGFIFVGRGTEVDRLKSRVCVLNLSNILFFDDQRAGQQAIPNVVPRLTETPGRVNSLGPALGAHNEEIYHGRLMLSDQELQQLIDAGVI